MNKGDYQRLLHIQKYCDDIAGFIVRFGNDFETFCTDRASNNAVSMCVLQIGELSNGLSHEFRDETKGEMPWGMIRGMRNWIAHAYAEMDESIVWETASNDIPSLRDFCQKKILQYELQNSQKENRSSVLDRLEGIKAEQPPAKRAKPQNEREK